MVEHKTCIGCKWNNYPTCRGIIMDTGNEMPIDNLSQGFNCGVRDLLEVVDFSREIKSELKIKTEELEERIIALEEKTKDLRPSPT
jgi:hypothetical protein